MKIEFAPSFFKSIKKLARQNAWWYKTYDFFRYDIGRFFGNVWKFRKELYNHRSFDSAYSLSMLRRSLELISDNIEKYGLEVDESRLKKVEKMKRAIEILKWHEKDSFIELAEKELGYDVNLDYFLTEEPADVRKSNKVIFDLATKIELVSFEELMEILKGQDYRQLNDDNEFDGSGIKTWWD